MDADEWKKLEEKNIPIELFPREKNETDLELALNKAIEMNPKEILIVAALGGRMDQTLANIALLDSTQYAVRNIRIDDGVEQIFLCRAKSPQGTGLNSADEAETPSR